MSAARVDVRGLTWRPWGRRDPVLNDVDLHLEPGERIVLAGPSGAGKSTLLRALAGRLSADDGELSGRVDVDGVAGLLLQDPTAAVVADRVGRDTAFGPENLALPRDEIWSRVRKSLRDSGFPYDLDRPTSALSGGEGQRLALAGALALRPGLLLLDEPAAMLDPPTAARVREAVQAVVAATGCTLVVVEHRMAPWLPHVDRLIVLSADGTVFDDGPPATVVAEHGPALTRAGLWVDDRSPVSSPVSSPAGTSAGGAASSAAAAPAHAAGAALLVARDVVGRPLGWRRGGPPSAVGPVDVDVAAGTVTAVTGPSGAGKSTVLALLAGLSAPTSGSLLADPAWSPSRERRPHRWRSRELARRLAWLPQLPEHAVVARTVREEVLATSRALGRPEAESARRAEPLLESLGLAALAGQDPHQLSGGEQRRLGLAAVLAHRPDLVLLDEPTVGQDRLTWLAVLEALTAAVSDGAAVALASHDHDLVDALRQRAETRDLDLDLGAGHRPRLAEPAP